MLAAAFTIAFNGLAATGYVNGITPQEISTRYPVILTPAAYAFSIWSLIYFGMAVFAVIQLLPANLERFRNLRTLFVASCVLNCGWIYFWLNDRPGICLVIIIALAFLLVFFISQLAAPDTPGTRLTKAVFGLYAGWVTIAAPINLLVTLAAFGVALIPSTVSALAVAAVLSASAISVLIVWKFRNYMFPLAVAWGLTAIAVEQSGKTALVVTCAIGVIVCLVACLSFVMTLPSMKIPQARNE
jgi:hypothetical protein